MTCHPASPSTLKPPLAQADDWAVIEYRFLEYWRESQVVEKAARRLGLDPATVRLFAEAARTDVAKLPHLVLLSTTRTVSDELSQRS